MNNVPGDGVFRRWADDPKADVGFNDDFNGFEDFFLGKGFDVVGCINVVLGTGTDTEDDVMVLSLGWDATASATGGDFVGAVVVSTVLLSLLLLLLLLLQLT